ncbi:MAG: hypothetical protein U1F60_14010 [Planctomycetota bacterium]
MAQADIAKKFGWPPTLVYAVKAREAGGGRAKNKKSGRGPGQPPKAMAASAPKQIDGLAGILEMVKRNDAERTRLLGALEKVAAAVRVALA